MSLLCHVRTEVKVWLVVCGFLFIGPLIGCRQQLPSPIESPPPTESRAAEVIPMVTEKAAPQNTAAVPSTEVWPSVVEPTRFRRLPTPLVPRSDADATTFLTDGTGIQTGSYRLEYDGQQFIISAGAGPVALKLTLPGGETLNTLGANPKIENNKTDGGEQLILTGQSLWADYQATLYAYDHHPGLLRWRLEVIPQGDSPSGPVPELQFIDRTSDQETSGQLEVYADHSPLAAPHYYAYSEALDSTLFYWVDLTALNAFMTAARFSPVATPVRQGQRLGHNFSRQDLRKQPQGEAVTLYDSYLYLSPGRPADEDEMFTRYLHNLGDIYDLIAVPEDPLPPWFTEPDWDGTGIPVGIHTETIQEFNNPEHWVSHEEKRYLRAYVSDTRETAEAITQLDVFSALARWKTRFGQAPVYYQELRDAIPDFFNPEFGPAGMFQNSGPLSLTGSQGRGDTWYELGHALKSAELALWDPADEQMRDLALRSGDTWMAFGQAVDYRFPKFYSFDTWQGTGQEPDAAGGYAYFMLLLHDMTGEQKYVDEARHALQALHGYGFQMAYETHMTAMTAAAAARLYQIDLDPLYLDVVNQSTANILRLSWLWESDYGFLVEEFDGNEQEGLPSIATDVRNRTFFGLNPTQNSAAITPKEQYEAWIYITETLQRLHGQLDPTVEKLLSEFSKHTLQTIPRSLPPFLPPGSATEFPAAYETVAHNDLSIFIPLEDLRDGWEVDGAIGQEIYGAGMAPALAALSLVELAPGLVVYSGYPLVDVSGEEITFVGIPGTSTPVVVWGAESVASATGAEVVAETCGKALCFDAEGGASYRIMSGD
jgi:hypothetical protein